MRRASAGSSTPGTLGARGTGDGVTAGPGGSRTAKEQRPATRVEQLETSMYEERPGIGWQGATTVLLGSGQRQRGARAMRSSAADRWEFPCRMSIVTVWSQLSAAATRDRLRLTSDRHPQPRGRRNSQ
eukprot:5257674-Amphidinium_carterae.1